MLTDGIAGDLAPGLVERMGDEVAPLTAYHTLYNVLCCAVMCCALVLAEGQQHMLTDDIAGDLAHGLMERMEDEVARLTSRLDGLSAAMHAKMAVIEEEIRAAGDDQHRRGAFMRAERVLQMQVRVCGEHRLLGRSCVLRGCCGCRCAWHVEGVGVFMRFKKVLEMQACEFMARMGCGVCEWAVMDGWTVIDINAFASSMALLTGVRL